MTALSAPARPPSPRPAVSRADVLAIARELVPVAIRRQLWVLFFDRDGVQLPMVVPLDVGPGRPDVREVEHLLASLARVAEEFGAASIAAVIEWPPAHGRVARDRDWARTLRECADRLSVDLVDVVCCAAAGVDDLAVDVTPPGRLGELGRGVDTER
ncbi:hypothetical protein ACPEEZ_07150 [Frigoribacterium sp. 2-23]|uniref:hypothetical protein n=1 Tax=Frigoribacterium sp. 2-23 TaxID=3415006 RepID=UPI003C6ED405